MRTAAASGILILAALYGCGNSKSDIDAFESAWRKRIEAEVPIGTDAAAVRAWFQKQGLNPQPTLKNSRDLEVWLGSISAREWFCDKWFINVVVKVSSEGKVSSYDFGNASGACL
jgi:hypothetical protein